MAYDKSKKHGVVNVARASGTENSTDIYSALVTKNDTPIECDNGTIIDLGAVKTLTTLLNEPNLEVYSAQVNTNTSANKSRLAIVATPELIYDESIHHSLDEYYNEAGLVVRAYALTERSCFSLSAECFTNPDDLGVNKQVTLSNNGKLTVGSEDTTTAPTFGFIENILEYDFETYYVVRIY